jgi:nucleoside-diphosphate-sugar epimerase
LSDRKKLLLVGCTSKISRRFVAAAAQLYELHGTSITATDLPNGIDHHYKLDFRDQQQVAAFIESVKDISFDGVLCFAAVYTADPQDPDHLVKHLNESIQVNVGGQLQIARGIQYADNSSLIFFGDAGLYHPKQGHTAYSLSKSMVDDMTRLLAIELQAATRVLCFRLGPVQPRHDRPDASKYFNRNLLKVADPGQGLINLLLFCIGEPNLGMTGTCIDYDGGAYLQSRQ